MLLSDDFLIGLAKALLLIASIKLFPMLDILCFVRGILKAYSFELEIN